MTDVRALRRPATPLRRTLRVAVISAALRSTNSEETFAVALDLPTALLSVKNASDRSSTTVAYRVGGDGAWQSRLHVCMRVRSVSAADGSTEEAGPFCMAEPEGEGLSLMGLAPGVHTVTAAVHEDAAAAGPAVSAAAEASVTVMLEQPFEPSWEWEPVHPWQSIPPGLEISLPLDGSGAKSARIPPRFRLQLWVALGAAGDRGDTGFFYRGEVGRDTTVAQIRRTIADDPRVRLPAECVLLRFRRAEDSLVVEDGATVGSLGLFARARQLTCRIDPGLAQPVPAEDDSPAIKSEDENR